MVKYKLSEEEIILLQKAMSDVQPLKPSNKLLVKPAKKMRPLRAAPPDDMQMSAEFSDHLRETVQTDQVLFFAQPGLPQTLLRDLKKGKIRQDAILDLHGYTVENARTAVAKTIQICLERNIRCFRIIHGKGKLQKSSQPILKNQVNNWLQQHQLILAFCSAQPVDGGTGAVYVLLKNVNKIN